MKFEWDEVKAASNFKKHGVTFDEAVTVFNDPFASVFEDEWNSINEKREIIIGYSAQRRILSNICRKTPSLQVGDVAAYSA